MFFDLGLIAFIVLFALLGMWKGVGRSVISLVALVATFFIAVLLTGSVSNWILSSNTMVALLTGNKLSLYSLYLENLPAELANYSGGSLNGFYGIALSGALERFSPTAGIGYQQYFAMIFSVGTFLILIDIILYLALRLLMMIATGALKAIFLKDEKQKASGRLLGFLAGGVKGAVWAMVLLILCFPLFTANFGFSQTMRTQVEESNIGKGFAHASFAIMDLAYFSGETRQNTLYDLYFNVEAEQT